MKKFILILAVFFSNTSAGSENLCTAKDLKLFAITAKKEIIAQTHYPTLAAKKGHEGDGSVVVLFDQVWKIQNVELLKSTTSKLLDSAMIDTIKTSSFLTPNCRPEKPVNLIVPFNFKFDEIEDNKPAHPELKINCFPQNILGSKPSSCS
jgi:Gram-negative bacterial TonB protein C-terminal